MCKVVVPNFYMDDDLMNVVTENYDPIPRVVRSYDGIEMVKITIKWLRSSC
jgi:hypothetical protein